MAGNPVGAGWQPSSTAVAALTVTAFGYVGYGNLAQAVIEVRTAGPGSVALAVTFAQPDGWEGGSAWSKAHRYTLSGHTDYTLTVTARIPRLCFFFLREQVAVVRVTATVPPSRAPAASASRGLWSDRC